MKTSKDFLDEANKVVKKIGIHEAIQKHKNKTIKQNVCKTKSPKTNRNNKQITTINST